MEKTLIKEYSSIELTRCVKSSAWYYYFYFSQDFLLEIWLLDGGGVHNCESMRRTQNSS